MSLGHRPLGGVLRRRVARVLDDGEKGSAVVEFVTLGVLLLVPVVYFVLVMGALQAAMFAVEGASREAARVVTSAGDEDEATRRVDAVVALALADQGLHDPGDPEPVVSVVCESTPCLTPESSISVTVEVEVVLPGVPAFVDDLVQARVPVRAEAVGVVDRFTEVGP